VKQQLSEGSAADAYADAYALHSRPVG